MGCDIHVYRLKKEDGGWKALLDIDQIKEDHKEFSGESIIGRISRNYHLFRVLTGVRLELPKNLKILYDPYDVSNATTIVSFKNNQINLGIVCSTPLNEILIKWHDDAHSEGAFLVSDLDALIAQWKIYFISGEADGFNPHQVVTYLSEFRTSCMKGWETSKPEDVMILTFFNN